MSVKGSYNHLNEDMPVRIHMGMAQIEVPMELVVEAVVLSNYGVHRFLSMLIDKARLDAIPARTKLLSLIETALNEGAY